MVPVERKPDRRCRHRRSGPGRGPESGRSPGSQESARGTLPTLVLAMLVHRKSRVQPEPTRHGAANLIRDGRSGMIFRQRVDPVRRPVGAMCSGSAATQRRGTLHLVDTASQLLCQHFKETGHSWRRIADELRRVFSLAHDCRRAEVKATKFILTWVRELRYFLDDLGKLTRRTKAPPIADDFTFAIAFCLEQFLAANGYCGRVTSEKKTHRHGDRPDVSIWTAAEKLVAVVECKIDFGYCRKQWQDRCKSREDALLRDHPDCFPFLCVLQAKNWDSSPFTGSPKFGKTWFCLCQGPLRRLSNPIADSDILSPIEPMFLAVLRRLESAEKI
jgi:hypothetical protein